MSDRPPAMLFYFKDFMTDGNVLAMTTEEKGAYLLLLCQAWEQDPPATIPNDDAILARWCGLTLQRFRTSRNCILRPFLYCLENNRYEQKRLKQEYERAVEAMKRQSNKGKSGANKRWGKNSTTNACAMPVLKPDQCLSNAQAMPNDSNRDRDNNTSSSYPHSSDKKEDVNSSCPEMQTDASLVQKKTKPSNGTLGKKISKTVLTFPTHGAVNEWNLTEEQVAKWETLFPTLDILGQCRNALAWCEANPRRQKTVSGMPKFLVGWLTKAQNRGTGPIKPIVLDMWDEPVTDEENEKGKEYYRLKEAQERMQEGEHDLDEVSGDDDITPF